jgi:hypothetical protein
MAGLSVQERHPELFMADKGVDPRTRKRVVPMEVLALGMPRTGTACKFIPKSSIFNPA